MRIDYKINVLRNGATFKEASFDASEPPRIDFNGAADIKASMSCVLLDIDDIQIGRDELQPLMRIDDGPWEPLGVFRVTSCIESGDEYGKRFTIDGYDRAWVLKNQRTTALTYYPKAAGYLATVRALLQTCGFALVVEKPPTNTSIPADAVFQSAHEWTLGTSYLTIINDILEQLGYEHIWFDAIGAAHLEPYRPPNPDNIAFTYSATNAQLAPIGDAYTIEEDYFDAPNQFLVVKQNPETGTTWARATNNSAISKKSTVNRGMTILQVTRIPDAYSSSACLEIAKRLRDESMMSQQEVTFYTLNEAGHGLGCICAIDYEPLTGLFYETGWSLTMDCETVMQHKAKRTIL